MKERLFFAELVLSATIACSDLSSHCVSVACCENSGCPDRDSNGALSEYKSEALCHQREVPETLRSKPIYVELRLHFSIRPHGVLIK